jgi:hypothetical protein
VFNLTFHKYFLYINSLYLTALFCDTFSEGGKKKKKKKKTDGHLKVGLCIKESATGKTALLLAWVTN